MTKLKQSYDVGILVGRFQVPHLHSAHIELIEKVINAHPKVIIFLGLSPLKCTTYNPLDFESRKQMILEKFPSDKYPNMTIVYIKDIKSDVAWSEKLDEQIKDLVGPTSTVLLYGGRASFIDHYKGIFDSTELLQTTYTSGTALRDSVSKVVKGTEDFRRGVIWASLNRFTNAMPTVDIAIMNKEETKVLLGRKKYEKTYRFIGGFVDPGENYEQAAVREGFEETHLVLKDLEYISTKVIQDWRYRNEKEDITTIFYKSQIESGTPEAGDDIYELKYFVINDLRNSDLTFIGKQHQQLMRHLLDSLGYKVTKEKR